MQLFNVYPLYNIEPVKALGSKLWDKNGVEYLDLYGGHAVISIGHSHPHYVETLSRQIQNLGFYSNSVVISLQEQLAQKLGKLSGLEDYNLFLCNSGAEANENALKLASFYNKRTKVVAFKKAFHGRTGGAVAVTDNPNIVAPINYNQHVQFVPFNDVAAAVAAIDDATCAVIIEGIQGVGGINVASDELMLALRKRCDETGAVLIHDSVQCGYGRSGKFFTSQFSGVQPDIITTAKGMGNGFPIGGVLISPKFEAKHFMLGTTFGGNHLASAAGIAVLEVIEKENLIENAASLGSYWMDELSKINGVIEVRGRGLMIGIEIEKPVDKVRDELLFNHHQFVGYSGKNTIRLLPSLALSKPEADRFLEAFDKVLKAV